MYPGEFDLHEAGSVEEALSLLAEHDDVETELLAGGHSLLPTMKTGLASPDVVIDIGQVDEMSGVSVDGDTVSIGATTTYAEVASSGAVQDHAPVVAEAAGAIGDTQVRNMGTIGGNVAHADPASDLPGAVIAANADVVVRGPDGERSVPAEEFFMGMYATDVGPGELVTRIDLPAADDAVGVYEKKASPSSGYAIVGLAAQVAVDGGTVSSASVAANGAMDHGVRLPAVEDAIAGESLDDDAIAAAASHATDDLDETMMMADIQASAEFRANLLELYTERALSRIADGAGGAAAD